MIAAAIAAIVYPLLCRLTLAVLSSFTHPLFLPKQTQEDHAFPGGVY
ncbi:MAG: hypothetical protein JSU01_02460, partial [Bacteroidetes bacterium]|nr:hypothetical protein [Bacteroidota bacterium]